MSEIKAMRQQDVLRVEPGGTTGHTLLEEGDKVAVKETKNGWSRVQAFELGDVPIGWVPVTSLRDPEVEVIDKTEFAESCWDMELRFGISAHYLAAVAELRSNTTADEKDGLGGPFRLSQSEFDAGRVDKDLLKGDFQSEDISNWRMQTTVFAAMTRHAEDELEKLLGHGQRASAVELYLAQMLGPQAAATLIKTPATTVGTALKDLQDRDQLLQRYGLSGGKTGEMTLQKIADDLTPALKAVEPFITEAGASIVAEVVAALPVGGGAADGATIMGSGNYPNIYPEGVLVQGDDLVVRNARASNFNDRKTASGITANDPNVLGCALPLPGSPETQGTPLPTIGLTKTRPKVLVKNRGNQKQITVELIDVGPSALVSSKAGIDLTFAAFTGLGEDLSKGIIPVDFTVIGGARFVAPDLLSSAKGSNEPPWVTEGRKDIDFHETGDNRGIQQFIHDAKCGHEGDKWCAIWANAKLERSGIGGTQNPAAVSFSEHPNFAKLNGPALGAIAVWEHHVAFYMGQSPDGGKLWVLGGNQDNMVSKEFKLRDDTFLGYWWPKKSVPLPQVGVIQVTSAAGGLVRKVT
jgi:uncharacterized protein (TIGR02594 family)